MEVTAAERTTIYTNISPLAQRVNNYIQTQHSSIAAVAKDIGYSRTTVSRYLTGKYDSNPNDLESKLTDFLTRQTGEAVDLTTPLAKSEGKTWQTPVFFESRDAITAEIISAATITISIGCIASNTSIPTVARLDDILRILPLPSFFAIYVVFRLIVFAR